MQLIRFNPLREELVCWEGSEIKKVRIEKEKENRILFDGVVKCVGYYDGHYRFCPNKAVNVKKCPTCEWRDIARLHTRLSIEGLEEYYEKIKNEEYSVYLASSGGKLKCGVTQAKRLSERMKEQGAEVYAEIARIEGIEKAYALEEYIQREYNVKNGIRWKDKLTKGKNGEKEVVELIEKLRKSEIREEMIKDIKIEKIEYLHPIKFELVDYLDGVVKEIKGQIVFFENRGWKAIILSTKIGESFTHQ